MGDKGHQTKRGRLAFRLTGCGTLVRNVPQLDRRDWEELRDLLDTSFLKQWLDRMVEPPHQTPWHEAFADDELVDNASVFWYN
jgi:hypothetical protein